MAAAVALHKQQVSLADFLSNLLLECIADLTLWRCNHMLNAGYPVQFSIDYPDRPLNRLTTFFRIFVVIPIGMCLEQ
jgi:hypothetical protein